MNQPKQPKLYVPKCSAKQVEFRDGGSILKLSFDAQTLAEFARNNKNEAGYLNLCVSKRREVGRYGETHTVWVDTWRPDPNRPQRTDKPHDEWVARGGQPLTETSGNAAKVDDDDVPF